MFVGRKEELESLERAYSRGGFQMAVIYGRRRVGKTSLIDEFVKDKRALYFTAQQKTTKQNLELFSKTVYETFSLPASLPAFDSWNSAFSFLVEQIGTQKDQCPLVLVFDEFSYAAEADPSLPSVLQVAIDHGFAQENVMIILCGSNEGFMESEVLGSKSPLYGRRTMQLKVLPFDYLDTARMLPGVSLADLVAYYATFGGTPYYLSQVDLTKTYAENVADLFFDKTGMLCEEPLMLLRQELQEPARYNSVLDAIGSGATSPSRIADLIGMNQNSVGKYLKTLADLGIIEKHVPVGDRKTAKRAIWSFKDPFFAYWYRFVSKYLGSIEEGVGKAVAGYATSGQAFLTYVGKQFEDICLQWVKRESIAGRLPFAALEFGHWWGTDPKQREQADIDVVAINAIEHKLLVGECKWRNSFDEATAFEMLQGHAELLHGYRQTYYMLFSKSQFSKGTRDKAAKRSDLQLVTLDDLYDELHA